MTNILVCDDRQDQCEKTVRALEGRGEVTPLFGDYLKNALTIFFESIFDVLNDQSNSVVAQLHSVFDGYDIVIVDNNLTSLELKGARLTAENVIGYLRAFTDSPYYVSLNKNLLVDFDLRFLFGDYQSLADIALNTKHLSNDCLWESGDSGNAFSPWYWPHLPTAAERRRQQVNFVSEKFQQSVWDSLHFPTTTDEYLSMHAKSALFSQTDQSYRETSFISFLDTSRAFTPAERKTLKNKINSALARQAIVRACAYEVDRWVRRDLLTPQDVLIDVPHLIAQMPNLLGEGARDLKHWNEAVSVSSAPFSLDVEIFDKFMSNSQFSESVWAPKSCFWWPEIKNNYDLMEGFYSSDVDWPDAVFCEDISRFIDLGNLENSEMPREFEAEIEGSWGRRYISNVDGVSYSPNSRILDSAI